MFVCAECGELAAAPGQCVRDGSVLRVIDDPIVGTEIGRYRVARLLGAGGMGRVYLGVQPAIGSRVAIKILSDQCARDPGLLERFFAEARAVNLIRHEHIVSVIDLAQLADGRPYIVMEFVDGHTLATYIRGGTAAIGGVVGVVGEVLGALGAAHAIGIVHRDLKPDNVLITAEGHVKVLDFGIAKLAPGLQGALSPRTQTGALLGTPAYMSPEQIRGGEVDPRTDIYAAGVVLFEAMTGRLPFTGDTLYDLMHAHLEYAPPSPRALRPELPIALEHVILQALAKRPDERFASAAAMVNALQQAAATLTPDQWKPLAPGRAIAMPRLSAAGAGSPSAPGQLATPIPVPAPMPTPAAVAPPVRSRRGMWMAIVGLAGAAISGGLVVALRSATSSAPASPDSPASPPPGPGGPLVIGGGRAADHGVYVGLATPPRDAGQTSIELPPDFDIKHFDPLAYLPKALALAQQLYPDAKLTEFEFHKNVFPDGHVDLTLPVDFESDYDFRSAIHSARPADLPANSPVDIKCRVNVTVTAAGVEARITSSETCSDELHDPPHCTLARVWTKARDAGVTAQNVVATIGFLHDGTWFFDLDDDVKSFPDDCR